jgi:hypothetical protein
MSNCHWLIFVNLFRRKCGQNLLIPGWMLCLREIFSAVNSNWFQW